jgi:hypothetical protein
MRAVLPLLSILVTACGGRDVGPAESGCTGHIADYPRDCSIIGPAPALDFEWDSPAPGEVLSIDRINVIGWVNRGTATIVTADGLTGGFLDGSNGIFMVSGVPIAPSTATVIDVRIGDDTGDVRTRKLLVAQGMLPMISVAAHIDEQRQITVLSTSRVHPRPYGLDDIGPIGYRLLDASGAVLYEGRIPEGGLDVTDSPDCYVSIIEPMDVTFLAPDAPGATAIDFVDEYGCRIGYAALSI